MDIRNTLLAAVKRAKFDVFLLGLELTVAGCNNFAEHKIPLVSQMVIVVTLHVQLEVPDVGVGRLADGTSVLRPLRLLRTRSIQGGRVFN